MSVASKIRLEGKDWFREEEAAEYCGIAVSTFKDHYRHHGIKPKRFGGRKLYSRADLYAAIAAAPEWQPSISAEGRGTSAGPKAGSSTADPSGRLRPVRLREFAARKKLS